MLIGIIIGLLVVLLFLVFVLPSIRVIGPDQIGLIVKRFGRKKLSGDNPVAFGGEAGYQSELLMPGWRWKFWVVYGVSKFP
ncbi:MAG: flotillin family protein, partial [Chloroflexi bacterium]|nr:flotillin family protein [Chloroflexota bacterium]